MTNKEKVLEKAWDLSLTHQLKQGWGSCYEVNCPKLQDGPCFDPKEYMCRRYIKAHFLSLAAKSIKEKT